jgi:hypothetical protein
VFLSSDFFRTLFFFDCRFQNAKACGVLGATKCGKAKRFLVCANFAFTVFAFLKLVKISSLTLCLLDVFSAEKLYGRPSINSKFVKLRVER